MSAHIRRVTASTFLTLTYSQWNTGTQLKRFENSSITSIRFKHKNSLLVSSAFIPIGDGIMGPYGGIKSNRSDPGNLNLLWFVAVAFGHRLWSLIKSDMLKDIKCTCITPFSVLKVCLLYWNNQLRILFNIIHIFALFKRKFFNLILVSISVKTWHNMFTNNFQSNHLKTLNKSSPCYIPR